MLTIDGLENVFGATDFPSGIRNGESGVRLMNLAQVIVLSPLQITGSLVDNQRAETQHPFHARPRADRETRS